MANGTGQTAIDFGTFPGSNEASVTVTGLANISNTSKVDAWVMADDSTPDHSSSDHKYFECFANLTCGTPTAGIGFIIYARSIEKLSGEFSIRYVWAD